MSSTFLWRDDSPSVAPRPDSVVLSCFPSAGLAATVAAHYMVRVLDLPRVGVLESDDALPLAIIQRGDVQPTIRVYGSGTLAIVLSEFPPSLSTVRPIADAILDGAERLKARLVLAIEGVVPHPMTEEAEGSGGTPLPDEQVWSVPSRHSTALEEQFVRARARPLTDGVIGGVSGALLVRGQRRSVPVAAMLVSARETEGYPDHRAGAALIEAIDRMLPDLKIDTGPLRTQAVLIEQALRQAMKSQSMAERPVGLPPETQTIYQ